jgi:type-F conjugative transfer system pilin assembly protein TrbC
MNVVPRSGRELFMVSFPLGERGTKGDFQEMNVVAGFAECHVTSPCFASANAHRLLEPLGEPALSAPGRWRLMRTKKLDCLFFAWLAAVGPAHAAGPAPAWTGFGASEECSDAAQAVDSLQTRATELRATLERPRSPDEGRAQTEAVRAFSDGHRQRREEETERLLQEVFGDVLREQGEVCAAAEILPAGRILPASERIYLFLSASIPRETLRNYARAVAAIGDPTIVMVLRGFVGGMRRVMPTRRWLLDILQKDTDCDADTRNDCEVNRVNVVIDPLLFRRFGVEHVPTLVYATDRFSKDDGSGTGGLPENARVADHVQISGDAALGYLLDRVQQETQSPTLARMVTTLRRLRE